MLCLAVSTGLKAGGPWMARERAVAPCPLRFPLVLEAAGHERLLKGRLTPRFMGCFAENENLPLEPDVGP